MHDQVDHPQPHDAGLARVDELLFGLASVDRAAATTTRLDRIAARSVPSAAPEGLRLSSPGADARSRMAPVRSTATRLAAALMLAFSIGAVLLAMWNSGSDAPARIALQSSVDAETDFAMLDDLFDGTGTEEVATIWSDAGLLDSRVSADWGSDDLFSNDNSDVGDSM